MNRSWLKRAQVLYREGKSLRAIEKTLRVPRCTVWSALLKSGVEMRPNQRGQATQVRPCPMCGKPIAEARRKTCSRACQYAGAFAHSKRAPIHAQALLLLNEGMTYKAALYEAQGYEPSESQMTGFFRFVRENAADELKKTVRATCSMCERAFNVERNKRRAVNVCPSCK